MRKGFILLTLAIFFFWAMPASSQPYTSIFGDSTTSWNIVSGYCSILNTDTIQATGDTLIVNPDSVKYSYKVVTGNPWVVGSGSYFLREDTVQGKVWIYDAGDSTEHLIMDMGLNIGDTFAVHVWSSITIRPVVDSVYYQNGLKHIRLNFWFDMCFWPSAKITFIEGSGPGAGIFYRYLSWPDPNGLNTNQFLLCHHKDSVKAYGNTIFQNECYYHAIGMEEHSALDDKIQLFPVPTDDVLHIETETLLGSSATLTIYNLQGKILHSETPFTPGMELDVSELEAGVYLVHISDKSKSTFKRFVKN